MKIINDRLNDYLNNKKQFICCDLYRLKMYSGNNFLFTDADIDITYDGSVYRHDVLLLKRQQTKLHNSLVVDNMTVSVKATAQDQLNGESIMKLAHDGYLDKAMLFLNRCFFDGREVVGAIDLFGGNVEVKSCGGLGLELTVKAKTQGLSQDFPVRRYYPQGTYSNINGTISAGTNEDSCLIAPFMPLKEVLL